jgi:hypothetical protein
MGFLDTARKKLPGLVKGRSKQIEGALDKVADVVDDKTKGKHADNIEKVVDKAKDAVRDLDPDAPDDEPSAS